MRLNPENAAADAERRWNNTESITECVQQWWGRGSEQNHTLDLQQKHRLFSASNIRNTLINDVIKGILLISGTIFLIVELFFYSFQTNFSSLGDGQSRAEPSAAAETRDGTKTNELKPEETS